MFRRSKSEPVATVDAAPSGGPDAQSAAAARATGKGRPTPTRKEAEAAAKARAKVPRTRKEMAAAQRAARSESSQKVRAGMRAGEEKFLPARDKGPVRRFIRDFVDSRFSFVELMIPILVVTMVLGYSGNGSLQRVGNTVLLTTVFLVVVDCVILRFRLRGQLTKRFPDATVKGTTYYAITRALQMRFMRLPKSQVKIGQELPEHYR